MVKSWAEQCLSSSEHLILILTASHSPSEGDLATSGNRHTQGTYEHMLTNVHTQKLNSKSVEL